ncbi:MAG: hypothetical protein HC888_17760 [Candidatus Competibacteraceae bacterium]|nr:hypothetical protein [Candidatus Competibacteraceae bacterium]
MDRDVILRLWKGFTIALIVVFSILLLTFPLSADHAIFVIIARGWAQGLVPYRDLWDIKPPGTFVIYLVSDLIFGTRAWGIRLIEILCYVGAAAMMTDLLRREGMPRFTGLLAAAMLWQTAAGLGFWQSAQTETFAGILLLTIVWLLWDEIHGKKGTTVPRGRDLARFLVAGFCAGFCTLMKPFFVLPCLVCALWAVWHVQDRAHARLLLLWGILAALLPIVVVTGILFAQGAGPDMMETFLVIGPELAKSGGDASAPVLERWAQAWRSLWIFTSFAIPMGFTLLPIFAEKKPGMRVIGFWCALFAVLIFAIGIQAKYYPYHFLVAVPLMCLLAAMGWWKAWEGLSHTRFGSMLLFLAFLTLLFVGNVAGDEGPTPLVALGACC